MGLTIELQNEQGSSIAPAIDDPTNALGALLPSENDDSYQLLKYIDRYGSTIFNGIQMKSLIQDLLRLESRAAGSPAAQIVQSIVMLAHKCDEGPHLYLNFIGD